jgi:hypothetical protein
MSERKRYEPALRYACDDPDCCYNGCPTVTCRYCNKEWPCPDYRATHTPAQVNAQRRWVVRVWYRPDDGMIQWKYRADDIEPCRALD